MATAIYGFGQFSDGTFGSFANSNVTAETSTEIQTGGTGLNQADGISIGQQYEGKVLVALSVQVQTDDATTGAFSYAYLSAPNGQIAGIVRGTNYQGMPVRDLCRPIKMENGVKLFAAFDAASDAVSLASLAVHCASGRAEVFAVKAVDATKTAMVSVISGLTIGQALAGETILKYYATYPASKGLNDNQAGVSAFYCESADGQLKYMFPPRTGSPTQGGGDGDNDLGYCKVPVRIEQNDTLSVMAGL
tara:strand:- start:2799 stop:3542 length:744 start_codon:yes stop_codon:yes gene_type:complete